MSDLRGEKRSINNDNGGGRSIELLDNFRELRHSWPKDMGRLFDPALDSDRRPALWDMMCESGDALRRRFSWAIPDERALRILTHFSPIVEIGSGLGYWAMLLRARGADIRAYDKVGGAPSAENSPAKKRLKSGESKDSAVQNETGDDGSGESGDEDMERLFWTEVEKGGPDVLEEACNQDRSLFLCYPDDFEGGTDSLGLQCIQSFDGDVVIHVGELFGDSVCMTPHQAPWGRTTSRECQEELAANFHCILKVPLPSWPHSRDTMTVWKRNKFSPITYGSDVDEDEEQKENGRTGKKDTSEDGDGAATVGTSEVSSEKEAKDDEEQKENGRTGKKDTSEDGDGAATAGASEVSIEKEAKDDQCSDEDDVGSEEDKGGSSSDGFLDLDIYAYVPHEEQILSAQAAPSVKFLLDM